MRYARQIIFDKIGKKGQQAIRNTTAVIVGIGAIGSTTANLLARAGVKKLVLIDRDIVELTNLQRQMLFTEEDINKPKVIAVQEHLKKINSKVEIEAYFDNLDYTNINLVKSDIILDCTDNLETRFLINEYAVKNKIPWIYSAVIGSSGYVFNTLPDRPCFRCVVKECKSLETCETTGVLNTIVNVISALQVNEALKIILRKDYEKKLLFFNIWDNTLIKTNVKKDKKCPACNQKFAYLTGEAKQDIVKFCGSGTFMLTGDFDFNEIKNRLKKLGKISDWEASFNFGSLTVFKSGKVLIKAKDEKEAKSIYSRYIGN